MESLRPPLRPASSLFPSQCRQFCSCLSVQLCELSGKNTSPSMRFNDDRIVSIDNGLQPAQESERRNWRSKLSIAQCYETRACYCAGRFGFVREHSDAVPRDAAIGILAATTKNSCGQHRRNHETVQSTRWKPDASGSGGTRSIEPRGR